MFYKSGAKPWKTPWARDGVCYVGIAYKLSEDKRTACCAAQMFLDSGDGVVFVGDFGPWYSAERHEFHLPPEENLPWSQATAHIRVRMFTGF